MILKSSGPDDFDANIVFLGKVFKIELSVLYSIILCCMLHADPFLIITRIRYSDANIIKSLFNLIFVLIDFGHVFQQKIEESNEQRTTKQKKDRNKQKKNRFEFAVALSCSMLI